MNVEPEMYAWMTSLNIIKPFNKNSMINIDYVIPEKVIHLLMGGKYFNSILKSIQEVYNIHHNSNLDLSLRINDLIEFEENQEYIPNSVKYENWHLVAEILNTLGLELSEDEINKVINGDKDSLITIMMKIYALFKELNSPKVNQKNENKLLDKQNDINNINGIKKRKKIKNEVINMKTLSENKPYEKCSSILEFFILSLCKNFKKDPRYSLAILANNQKELSIICKEGIDGMVTNWIYDLDANSEIMIKLIQLSDDGLNISYEIIGSAIQSNEENVSLESIKLINKIFLTTKTMDFNWLKQKGLTSLMFSIYNFENNKLEKINFLYEFIKEDIRALLQSLKNKSNNDDKIIILNFLSDILPISNQLKDLNPTFFKEIQNILYDICFDEVYDMSLSATILAESFIYFHPIDNNLIEQQIILYLKACIKSNSLSIFGTAVTMIFYLINQFSEKKDKYAPKLYKILVFQFLEYYNDIDKRQYFLDSFQKFFNEQQQIPIDIFLEPYISQIISVQDYNLNDLSFIFNIIEHPRIESQDLVKIINFLLGICLNDIIHSRTSNLIMSLIFEKKLIQNLCTPSDTNLINLTFIDFINNSLELFMSTINNVEDPILLEMPFDIINQDFPDVNNQVHNTIASYIKKYRKIKGSNCNGLLAIFWQYPDHDDILLEMEEENRPKYKPCPIILKKSLEKRKQNIFKIVKRSNTSDKEKKHNAIESIVTKTEEKKNNKKKLDLKSINKLLIRNKTKEEVYKNKNKKNIIQNINLYSQTFKYSKVEKMKKVEEIIIKRTHSTLREKQYKEYSNMFNINIIKNKTLTESNTKVKSLEEQRKELIQEEGKLCLYKENEYDNNPFFGIPIILDDEENREAKAIKGYLFEYKKSLNYYFKLYSNEVSKTITKNKLIRFLKKMNIYEEIVSLEQINYIIKGLFNDDYSEFDFNQFCNILVQIAYLMYIKRRPTLTISETFGILMRKLKIKDEINSNKRDNIKKMSQVINLLLEKKAKNEPFNLPEGFKFVTKKSVKYNSKLPMNLLSILGESKFICFQVLEEIIFDIFNSSIIEPFVEINNEIDVELETEKIHIWTPAMYIAYINLDKKYDKIGIEVADTLEYALRNVYKGKNPKILKKIELKKEKEKKISIKQTKFLFERRKIIKERIYKYKEEKKKKYLKKKKELLEIEKKRQEEILKNREKFEKILERRNKIEKEKLDKLKKKKEKEKKKKETFLYFLFQKKKKTEKDNEELSRKQKLIMKLKEEEEKLFKPVSRSPFPYYFQENKKDIEFDHELNNIINGLLEREDIKKVFDDYDKHLQLIYDTYSKLESNKISFNYQEGIKEESFKQFLTNFTILGLLVSSNQMNWIYKVITRKSLEEKGYHDFKMALCYLTIMARFTEKERKIMKEDIDSLSGEHIEIFFQYMGLDLPFKKEYLTQFIKDRRTLTTKELLKLQKKLKEKDVLYFKKNQKIKEIKNKIENDKNIKKNNNENIKIKIDSNDDTEDDIEESPDEDIDFDNHKHNCSKNMNEYQKKKKSYELKIIGIKDRNDEIKKVIKKQNDIINEYKKYINEVKQKSKIYNEKMNIKFSDSNDNFDANGKLSSIYEQIEVIKKYISEIKEININAKDNFKTKIESELGYIQESLTDINDKKVTKKKKIDNIFENIEKKFEEIEKIYIEFEEHKKIFYEKNKKSEKEYNKLKSIVKSYNADFEKWKSKYEKNVENFNNNNNNQKKVTTIKKDINNNLDKKDNNYDNDGNNKYDILLLKVKDPINRLNSFKDENLFNNEEENKYENYKGKSFILHKNWNEICYVYDNYNIYEVNYDIQAIGLKKGSFFPSINHECYYDAQILSCEINGEKGKYKLIGTLLQLEYKLYNLDKAKIYLKYKEIRKKNEDRSLYRNEHYGLRKSLAGEIAKFRLILKTNTFEIIQFDKYIFSKNENSAGETEYIWGGLVPEEGNRVLITFSRKKAIWSFRSISKIISTNKMNIKKVTFSESIRFIGGNNKIININYSSPQTNNIKKDEEKGEYIVKYKNTKSKEVTFEIKGMMENNIDEWVVDISDEDIEKKMPEKDVEDKEKLQEIAKKIIKDFDEQNKDSDFEFLDYMKIALWVYKNIKYEYSFTGLKLSAMEIYKVRRGVCNHMTVLSNALLYSLGYKVLYVAGLTGKKKPYFSDKGTHAWSLIKLGNKWTPFDSTWGIILGKVSIAHIFSKYGTILRNCTSSKGSTKMLDTKINGMYIPPLKLKNK